MSAGPTATAAASRAGASSAIPAAATQQRSRSEERPSSSTTQTQTQAATSEGSRRILSYFPLGYKDAVQQWWSSVSASAAERRVLSLVQNLREAKAGSQPDLFSPTAHEQRLLQEGDNATATEGDPHGPRLWRSQMVPLSGKNRALNEYSVERAGEEATDTLVMLHGYGAGLGFFYRNFEPLSRARGWRLFALDMLGMGNSSRPTFRVTAKDGQDKISEAEAWFVDALEEWRQIRRIERFTLLGHSLGGYLAVAYALKYPGHLNKLILASPVGIPEDPYAVSADLPEPAESTMAAEFAQDQHATVVGRTSGPPSRSESDVSEVAVTVVTTNTATTNTATTNTATTTANTTTMATATATTTSTTTTTPPPSSHHNYRYNHNHHNHNHNHNHNQHNHAKTPSSKPVRRPLPGWLVWLWDANVSPFTFVRASGPLGPRLVSGWTSRRFSHLPPDEADALHAYTYSLFRQRGSGEYALPYLLAPGAYARRPVIQHIQDVGRQPIPPATAAATGVVGVAPVGAPRETGIPIVMLYGDHDWMDVAGGYAAEDKIRKRIVQSLLHGTPDEKRHENGSAKVLLVRNAGHHLYLDNPTDFNAYIQTELDDTQQSELRRRQQQQKQQQQQQVADS